MRAALARLVEEWGLTVEAQPVETFAGLVAFVRQSGRAAVLKIHGPRSDEHRSADVLAHHAGQGAVRLLARDRHGLLVERVSPGTALATLVSSSNDDGPTAIIADTIAALHAAPGTVAGLVTVAELACGFVRHRRAGGDPLLDAALVARAEAFYRDLAASQAEPVVLHGDLHHFNILEDRTRGWLAIDPKGMLGEPAYEVGASLRNPNTNPALYADPAIISRRVSIYSERLGFDRERMLGWCFAQAVLATIWAIEDGLDPAPGIAAAEAALPLLRPSS